MSANNTIEHMGVVSDIVGSVVQVKIESNAACSTCHSKSACLVADKIDKIVDIDTNASVEFSINEKVLIILKKADSFKALYLGYIMPLLLIVLTLIILTKSDMEEIKAGIISLLILIPYYLILYIYKKQIKNNFTFELKKIGQ
ncbi:SoxR reducing system RseC family protein [Bacteroidota bacterium]